MGGQLLHLQPGTAPRPTRDGLSLGRACAAAVPLSVLVTIAGIVALLGFLTGSTGKQYAQNQFDNIISLAAVLAGVPRPARPRRPHTTSATRRCP